jgi:hypothetical protein
MNTPTQSQEVINFGKFKGTAIVDLKHTYVRWLLTLENLDESLKMSTSHPSAKAVMQTKKARRSS